MRERIHAARKAQRRNDSVSCRFRGEHRPYQDTDHEARKHREESGQLAVAGYAVPGQEEGLFRPRRRRQRVKGAVCGFRFVCSGFIFGIIMMGAK